MARWFGTIADTASATGGTKYSELKEPGTVKIVAPTLFTPATSAQVEDQEKPIDRKTEVRGRRGEVPPQPFRGEPLMTVETHAYPKTLRSLLRNALGGAVTHAGGPSPKAYEDTVEPLQSGKLPTLVAWLLREEQLDRMTGAVVSILEMNCPIDGEGTIKATLEGLFHTTTPSEGAGFIDPSGASPNPLPTATYEGYEYAFMLRDILAEHGPSGTLTKIENLVGFEFAFNNGMITDPRSKYGAGLQIETREIDTVKHKLW